MAGHHEAPVYTRDQLVGKLQAPIPASIKSAALALAVLGFATFAYGAATGSVRAWTALLINWLFFTIISSAGVMFAAVQRIVTARWSRAVIRLLEGYVAFLPLAFVILLLIVFVGAPTFYPWFGLVGTGELIPEKEQYFNHTFFYARNVLIFGGLVALQLWYVWTSLRLDVGVTPEAGASWAAGIRARMRAGFGDERRELHSTHSLQGKLAVIMALVFGFGWCVLAWDHSMSLNYHFFSTMYGWQVFMGGWLAALMSWSILVRWWRNHLGVPDLITESHFHDIGKLCFAFTAFWGYITFSQFLVIWYGNIAEETHFFTLRLSGMFKTTTMATVWLVFALPFFGLLSVKAKKVSPVMIFFACSSLLGIWFARYTEVYPSIWYGVAPDLPFGVWEVLISLGFLGAWVWCYAHFMDAFPRMRVFLMTSKYRDEVQVPVDPRTMEPLPAHE